MKIQLTRQRMWRLFTHLTNQHGQLLPFLVLMCQILRLLITQRRHLMVLWFLVGLQFTGDTGRQQRVTHFLVVM